MLERFLSKTLIGSVLLTPFHFMINSTHFIPFPSCKQSTSGGSVDSGLPPKTNKKKHFFYLLLLQLIILACLLSCLLWLLFNIKGSKRKPQVQPTPVKTKKVSKKVPSQKPSPVPSPSLPQLRMPSRSASPTSSIKSTN